MIDLDVPATSQPRRPRSRWWLALLVLVPLLASGAAAPVDGPRFAAVGRDCGGRLVAQVRVTLTARPPAERDLASATTTGTARTWKLGVVPRFPALRLSLHDANGGLLSETLLPVPAGFYGREWTVQVAGEDVSETSFNAYVDVLSPDGRPVVTGLIGPVPGEVGCVTGIAVAGLP